MDPVRNIPTPPPATLVPDIFELPKTRTPAEEKIDKQAQKMLLEAEPSAAKKELPNIKLLPQVTTYLEDFGAIGNDIEKFQAWKQKYASLLGNNSDFQSVFHLIRALIKQSIEDKTSPLSEKERRLLYKKVAETLNLLADVNDLVNCLQSANDELLHSLETNFDQPWVEDPALWMFDKAAAINPVPVESEKLTISLCLFEDSMPFALISPYYTESEHLQLRETLEKFPPEERQEAVTYITAFSSKEMSLNEKVTFFQVIQNLPKKEIADIIEVLPLITLETHSVHEKLQILQAICSLSSLIDRKKLIQTFQHLFTPRMSVDERICTLWLSPSMPQDEKDDLVKAALSLFNNTMSVQEKNDLLHVLIDIFPLTRKNRVDALQRFFTPEMSLDERMLHLQILPTLPPLEREDLVQATLPLLTGFFDLFSKQFLLGTVISLPPLQRKECVDAAFPFFTSATTLEEKVLYLLIEPYQLPHDERTQCVQAALTLSPHISNRHILLFLTEIVNIPSFERWNVITHWVALVAEDMTEDDKIRLLQTITTLPLSERIDIIAHAMSLFAHAPSWSEKIPLLTIIVGIRQSERADVINHAKVLFTDEMDWSGKIALLTRINGIRQSERADIINHAKVLFTDGMDWSEKDDVLRTISGFRQAERADVLNYAQALFTDRMTAYDKTALLRVIHSIRSFDRADVISHVKALFTSNMDWGYKISLLNTFRRFSRSERAEVINYVGDMPLQEMTAILTIPSSDRVDVIKSAKTLFPNAEDSCSLLEKIYSIPKPTRADVVQCAKRLLTTFSSEQDKFAVLRFVENIHPSQREEVVTAIASLPEEKRCSLCNSVNNSSFIKHVEPQRLTGFIQKIITHFPLSINDNDDDDDDDDDSEVSTDYYDLFHEMRLRLFYFLPDTLLSEKILSQNIEDTLVDPRYQTAIITAFEREVYSNTTNPELLISFAKLVYKYSQELMLHDEHSVMQQAIEILTVKNIKGEKNPCTLYSKLKKLANEPISFQPPSYTVAGINTSICLETLRKNRAAFHISREELPRDATEEAWKRLIKAFQDKIESTSEAEQQLQHTYDTSWEDLWEDCLSDSYLVSLLRSSGPSVSIVEAQFRAILHNILAKETGIKEGCIFSEQEELLIKTAMSIRKCAGGKKEGISQTYHLLEPQYRYPTKGFETGDAKKDTACAFLTEQVQKIVTNQFIGTNALMHELTGEREVNESPHQAIYLKNLIGPIVGLYHDVAFDRHTSVLYDSLLAKSREEVLQIFFHHLTPQTLVSALVTMANNKNNAHVFKGHLRAFIEDPAEIEQWELTDDGTLNVTDRAMVHILKKIGYIR